MARRTPEQIRIDRANAEAAEIDAQAKAQARTDADAAAQQQSRQATLSKVQNVASIRPSRVFNPGASQIANGFPPADDLVMVALVVAVIGNVARDHKTNTTGNPIKWLKLVFSAVLLAIILGLMDRGSFAGPVRAFAALGLLAVTLYYTQYILPDKAAKPTKAQMTNATVAEKNQTTKGS